MNPNQRTRKILVALRERGELSVDEVCALFEISPATARRDFINLANSGEAVKTWGGLRALPLDAHEAMLPIGVRNEFFIEGKRRIATAASQFCAEGDIVFIDGGTTTLHLARLFANRSLRIITNSLLVAHEIDRLRSGPNGPEVFLTGGYLYPGSGLLVGPEATAGFGKYRAQTAFLSVGGIGEEGITNNHHLVVEIERRMIERSEKVVLLADHSKFDRHDLVLECSWQDLHVLVTDSLPPENYVRMAGERLVVAEDVIKSSGAGF